LKIVFMGTPEFAAVSLDALFQSSHDVVAVFTQPDRPAGRGHKLAISPVKACALLHDIPVYQPHTLWIKKSMNDDEKSHVRSFRETLAALEADVFVVAAYGIVLPQAVLDIPKYGCINIHASLLPKYRGASPIHQVLLNGDDETGISIMQMDAGLDTGDVLLMQSLKIGAAERFVSLHDRLAALGADLCLDALMQIEENVVVRAPQDDAQSCYAPIIKKTDGRIHWQSSVKAILNQNRALDIWPGTYTHYDGEVLKIHTLEAAEMDSIDNRLDIPGSILIADAKSGLFVKTGDGIVKITELQGMGSKRMPAGDFLRGRTLKIGTVLI